MNVSDVLKEFTKYKVELQDVPTVSKLCDLCNALVFSNVFLETIIQDDKDRDVVEVSLGKEKIIALYIVLHAIYDTATDLDLSEVQALANTGIYA